MATQSQPLGSSSDHAVAEYERANIAQVHQLEDVTLSPTRQPNPPPVGFKQAFKKSKKSSVWGMLYQSSLIAAGYGMVLIPSDYTVKSFNERFGNGTNEKTGNLEINTGWKIGFTEIVLGGEIVGSYLGALIADQVGFKKPVIGALVFGFAVTFLLLFAKSLSMILVGQLLSAMTWGLFQILANTFAAEICTNDLRPYLCTLANAFLVLGQLLGAVVTRASVTRGKDDWAWKIPFAAQLGLFPVPLIGCLIGPESPFFLVRRGKEEEAKKVLRSLHGSDEVAGAKFLDIMNTNSQELVADLIMEKKDPIDKQKTLPFYDTSYSACFRGTNFRRTEIVCMVWLIQNLCGSPIMALSPFFFESAGLKSDESLNLQIAQYIVGLFGNVCGWFLMSYCGRRSIYLWGCICMFILTSIVGITSTCISDNDHAGQKAIGAMVVLFGLVYNTTVGTVCYAIQGEAPSTRLKAKSMAIARTVYNIGSAASSVLLTYMLGGWKIGGKSAFMFAGTNAGCIIWIYLRLPEFKDLTFQEIDKRFNEERTARKWDQEKLSSRPGSIATNSVDDGESKDDALRASQSSGELTGDRPLSQRKQGQAEVV